LRRRRARDLAGWLPAKDACADAGAPPRFSFFQGVAHDMNDSSDLFQVIHLFAGFVPGGTLFGPGPRYCFQ